MKTLVLFFIASTGIIHGSESMLKFLSSSKETKISIPQSAETAAKSALKKGDRVKPFELRNHLGQKIPLSELLKKGPVVLSFYRGGWCPFCNNELKELKKIHKKVQALGGVIIAVAPEASNKLRETQEHNSLPFDLLSDPGNQVAQQFGVAFALDPSTSKLYRERKIVDLKSWNALSDEILPIPATFLIDSSSKIRYAFVQPDYKQRVDKNILLKKLENLKPMTSSADGNTYKVKVKGMTCEGCAQGINMSLKKDRRIKDSQITFAQSGGTIQAKPKTMNQRTLKKLIEEIGYEVEEISGP